MLYIFILYNIYKYKYIIHINIYMGEKLLYLCDYPFLQSLLLCLDPWDFCCYGDLKYTRHF